MNYGFVNASSIYVSLLSALLGNFNVTDFTRSYQKHTSIILLTLFVVVLPIVLLNLLISIVGGKK